MTDRPRRPTAVLAMWPGFDPPLLTGEELDRLGKVVELADREPLTEFQSERAAVLLGRAKVIVGHWGCPTLDAAALDLSPGLEMFAYAAGTLKEYKVVTDAVWERGILVTTGAAANAEPVAEYTIAAILFANKDVFNTRERYRGAEATFSWPQRGPVGNYDKQVGLVGASRIGRRVIELLEPFELGVAVYDPYLDVEEAAALGVVKMELAELLETSDVVSIHAPALPETHHLIGVEEISLLQDGATLINTARGSLVDPSALEAELLTGRISAVLDVTDPEPMPADSPLHRMPNVFLTPHIAGSQGSEYRRMAAMVIDEVARFTRGEPPLHPVRRDEVERMA
ncbi:MAG: Erythronate-4-phosphate dehydrogenase [Acidimicrobiales bacterium]|nr:MAG: hydroxyacid dehydrogenase [Actinomycetota bacterium]MBV6507899.1 Erythronate-4-phosphate dehydrogenase [Acidimicrobiales bacterium]RIK06879.1 MAG: hydroxyacid dehydrogenase [Acidobacteriota bacterium]